MSKKVLNASQEPRRYFGLHMTEGVAEYRNGGKVSRLFIGEDAIKKMNRSFEGRPIYVNHVTSEPLETLEKDMDGIVVKSFFNKADGKHWAEFLVWTDEAHEAINKGWRLSNAYRVSNASKGGQWHNVDYDEEVLEGEFRHLAIVENPRYEESVIFTPDEFKSYNDRKEAELKSIENAKEKPMSVLNFFRRKKEEIQNVADLKDAFLELDGKEVSVMDMIEAVKNAKKNDDDEKDEKKEKESKMNMDSEIEVGEEKMSVKELVKKYQSLNKKENDDKDEEKKEKKDKKENDDEDEKKKEKKEKDNSKENAKTDDEKKKEQERFDDLKNAPDKHNATDSTPVVEINSDRMKRGQERYGSVS